MKKRGEFLLGNSDETVNSHEAKDSITDQEANEDWESANNSG